MFFHQPESTHTRLLYLKPDLEAKGKSCLSLFSLDLPFLAVGVVSAGSMEEVCVPDQPTRVLGSFSGICGQSDSCHKICLCLTCLLWVKLLGVGSAYEGRFTRETRHE